MIHPSGQYPSLASGLQWAFAFSRFFGYCPILFKSISPSYLLIIYAVLLLIFQTPLVYSLFSKTMFKSDTLFSFTDASVLNIVHLSVVLNAFLNAWFSLFSVRKWRALIQALRMLPKTEMVEDGHASVKRYCLVGLLCNVLGITTYICFMAFDIYEGSGYGSVIYKNLQEMLVVVNIITPAFLCMVVARHLELHLSSLLLDFQTKFNSFHGHKYPVIQALTFSESFFKLIAAIEDMDAAFCRMIFISTCGILANCTFTAYYFIMSTDIFDRESLNVLFLAGIQVFATLIIIYRGNSLNEQVKNVNKELMMASPERCDERATAVLHQVSTYVYGADWGLTAGGFFQVDRTVILTILGVIISHLLVLVELGVYRADNPIPGIDAVENVGDEIKADFTKQMNEIAKSFNEKVDSLQRNITAMNATVLQKAQRGA